MNLKVHLFRLGKRRPSPTRSRAERPMMREALSALDFVKTRQLTSARLLACPKILAGQLVSPGILMSGRCTTRLFHLPGSAYRRTALSRLTRLPRSNLRAVVVPPHLRIGDFVFANTRHLPLTSVWRYLRSSR